MKILLNIAIMELEWVHPPLWLLGCAVLGLLAAWQLYRKDKAFADAPSWQKWLMPVLRFFTITILLALLLTPIIKSLQTHTEEKQLVILQDNSASLLTAHDTTDLLRFEERTTTLLNGISDEVGFSRFYFADECSRSRTAPFDGKSTDITNALDQVKEQFSAERLSGIVLVTDGIYNKGQNPYYQRGIEKTPVYVVAMGDTTAGTDAEVRRIFHNRVTYKGDEFVVEVDLAANELEGNRGNLALSLISDGKSTRLQSEQVTIDKQDFFTTVSFKVQANTPGVQHYRISFPVLKEERNKRNNYKDFFIDVIESRQNILIVANAPHPDLNSIKNSLEGLENYAVDIRYAKNFEEPLTDYDLVVLHGLPSVKQPVGELLKRIGDNEKPSLFIVSNTTDVRSFNRAQDLVSIQQSQNQYTDAEPVSSDNFTLFTVGNEISQFVRNLPPLRAPFGSYSASSGYEVLFNQSIKNVETNYPLIILGETNGVKRGVVTGDGIWKWRMYDYAQNQSFERADEIVSRIFQYLAVAGDKRRFKIQQDKSIYNENDRIFLSAEYYNASYELKNEEDVDLTITNDAGESSSFAFSRTGDTYSLDLGNLEPGNYSYSGELKVPGQRFTASGKFTVRPVIAEMQHLRADHQFLKNLATVSNGKFYLMSQLEELQSDLMESNTIKPLYITDYKRSNVLQFKWLLLTLLVLLSLEWFMRKFLGSY